MVDQQRLQISELRFDKFPTPPMSSSWMIRFKTQVSACSSSPSEEMVDPVENLKSSRSIQGYSHFQIFWMLDASIASALNKIIHRSYFKEKVSLEEQKFAEDRSHT